MMAMAMMTYSRIKSVHKFYYEKQEGTNKQTNKSIGHIGSQTAKDAESLGMNVKGYDPGLSIASALKLPRSIEVVDSITAAVAGADYISINIPYSKGTHGIIGKDVISHFSPDAVLLNFARGELVDSEAMKEFLDSGNGRYVSDFPEDLLWDHKNTVILPHLGASTEEAEDAAVSSFGSLHVACDV